jgi:hypothetical protein
LEVLWAPALEVVLESVSDLATALASDQVLGTALEVLWAPALEVVLESVSDLATALASDQVLGTALAVLWAPASAREMELASELASGPASVLEWDVPSGPVSALGWEVPSGRNKCHRRCRTLRPPAQTVQCNFLQPRRCTPMHNKSQQTAHNLS